MPEQSHYDFRLHIKSKSFEEAITWATTAIDIKQLFTFYDTRGQALKIKLRDMLGKNPDVESAVETARCAADNFQVCSQCSLMNLFL
jgi:hypothetical protein